MKYWKLTVLAMTAITASSHAQNAGNHNPAFSVPNTFIGGEPYIFIGENDGEVFEPRTPVGLQLRNPPGQDEPYNGSTTLQWSSSPSGVLAFDGELSMTGFKEEDRETGTAKTDGPWTWTRENQANFHDDTVYLQGSASAQPVTVTLESFHSKDPDDKFTKDFTLLKVDLITPGGNHDNDPVNDAIDGGDGTGTVPDGANEFTFSSAMPGVLTIQFKADAGGFENDVVDKITFSVEGFWEDITWGDNHSGGSATVSDGSLIATGTFTGLPGNNSAFGAKTVKLMYDGNVIEEKTFEVFWPLTDPAISRDNPDNLNLVANSPTGTRNFLFYWLQTVSLIHGSHPEPTVEYGSGGNSGYSSGTSTITIGYDTTHSKTKEYVGSDNPLEGIDLFAWTIAHESQHYKDWKDRWGESSAEDWQVNHVGFATPKDDFDADRIPNEEEDANLNGSWDQPTETSDWMQYKTPGVSAYNYPAINEPNDNEDAVLRLHSSVRGDKSADWGDPGMNHGTKNIYDD